MRDELEDNELFISDNAFMCMQCGRSERKGCVFPVLLRFSLFSLLDTQQLIKEPHEFDSGPVILSLFTISL